MKKAIKYFVFAAVSAFILYGFVMNEMSLTTFRDVTIQMIQFKSNDSLAVGKDKSDILGDSIRIVGRVIAPPTTNVGGVYKGLLRGSNSYTTYIQDTANNVYGGMVVRANSRFTNTNIQNIDSGYVIRTKGFVQEFPASGFANSLTQIGIDTVTAPINVGIISTSGSRPAPKLVTVADFATGDYVGAGGTINYVGGEKYEGMFVELRNVYVSSGIGNRQPIGIIDDAGNKMYLRDFSNYFSTQPSETLGTVWTPPAVGTFINYIRGVIIAANNTDAQFGNQLPYCIVPIYPGDLSLGNAPPSFSNYSRTPGVPTPSDSVQVTVTVNDSKLSPVSVSEVRVFWRLNGGAFNSKVMSGVGSNYSTKMPPAPLNTYVEYYLKATDNLSTVKLLPTDTAKSKLFYVVKASDSLSIQEIQYCPNLGGRSGFENASVRGVEGICTADTSDIRAFSYSSPGGTQTSPRRVIIQNGTGPNSGIWISGNATDVIRKGDRVRVSGTVEENFSVTRISLLTAADLTILSTGNPQPNVENLSTQILANSKADGDTTIEKWESVFVRFNTPVTISCINAGLYNACTSAEPLRDTAFRRNFGEILVKDNSNYEARIELQDGNHTFTNNWDNIIAGKTLLTKNDSITFVQGILFFSFGNYKMVPRKNADFGTVIPVGIIYHPELVTSFALSQNYPNPFNPVTKINFSVPSASKVTLKVYDILGKEVNSFTYDFTMNGTYTYSFDGRNLASGVYFYKFYAETTNEFKFTDTKRMVLVK